MKPVNAEIISIGNEILAGYTVNTNATWISQQLKDIGIVVNRIVTIPDLADHIFNSLDYAEKNARVVVVTGGLGPTPDDITKSIISKFFNSQLIENEMVFNNLMQFAKERGRDNHFIEINRGQALVPDKAQIISNSIGTAPGLILSKNNTWFVFMPGVPREMKSMFFPHFIEFLKQNFKLAEIKSKILRTTGIAESRLHDIIKNDVDKHPDFPISFLPKQIGVDLRFHLTPDIADKETEWNQLINVICKKLDRYIFTRDERSMQEVMIDLLTHEKKTVSVAESFTGGLIQDWLTNVPGSSNVFLGGLVTYSNKSKSDLANVDTEIIKKHGAVSEQTAIQMVRGVQKCFNSDCAISATGIAGPSGGSKDKPVGLCFIAARNGNNEIVKKFNFGTDRRINKMRGAVAGLEMLRRLLV